MTRFEKAWQALVCREGDRLKPVASKGYLTANIHRKQYSTHFGLKGDTKQPAQSEQLPHWLCYALDYHLHQEKDVAPFGSVNNFSTVFYPWQRGFFTKFEQKLDEVVLERAYDRWEEAVEESEASGLPIDINDKRPQPSDRPLTDPLIDAGDDGGRTGSGIQEEEEEEENKELENKANGQKIHRPKQDLLKQQSRTRRGTWHRE